MIKPYSSSCLEINNLSAYQEFLKKRHRKAFQFKFSMIKSQFGSAKVQEKLIQVRLLKALKNVKLVSKAHFQDCEIADYNFWKAKLLSAFKQTSHIKTFFIKISPQDLEFKYFKYFPKLQNLLCQLDRTSSNFCKKEFLTETHNYLKYLKYCPKMGTVNFDDLSFGKYSPGIDLESSRYLRSLETLVLDSQRWTACPIEFCRNLRSISFRISSLSRSELGHQIFDILSKLPNLQDLGLNYFAKPNFDFEEAFEKITKKQMLKKVRIEFGWNINLEKILEALKICKLTYFCLKTFIKKEFPKSISQLIKSMTQLESLELHIENRSLFSEDENLIELCKQIKKLQMLQSLTLDFEAFPRIYTDSKNENFIPYLCDLFLKPIKIQILNLSCNQLDPSEALQSLISTLKNSTIFLTHLRINFETLPCTKKTYRSILELLQNLSAIQVFEIPCLAVSGSTSQFLKEIAEALHAAKYLRTFAIGEIKETVSLSDFWNAAEAIERKRGLRQFHFSKSNNGFQMKLKKENKLMDPYLKRIRQKNPHLEKSSHFRVSTCSWIKIE